MIGKKNSTLKKQNVNESKLLATGVKSLKFWHEASDGELAIPFGSLVFPSDLVGEQNPTSTEILAANLNLFKSNVEVFSSSNQYLMQGLTYLVKNSQILFINGYVAEEGEVFQVTAKNQVVTGTNIVDARPLTATGTLTAGVVDFPVGEAFQIGQYPNGQLGEVMVFVDGLIQHRNTDNATAAPGADGNYEEVHSSNGFGSIIRFNNAYASDKPIQVMSRGLIAERPDISMMQLIETLGGQIDKIIEYVAQDMGVDPLIFQTGPNELDLKAFGDCVYQNKQDIAANTALIDTKHDQFQIDWQEKILGSSATVDGPIADLTFNNLVVDKWYRITVQADLNPSGTTTNQYMEINYTTDGNKIFRSSQRNNGSSNDGIVVIPSVIFKAQATTLIANGIFRGFGSLQGSGTKENSFAQLEELPNHTETSKWT